MILNLKVKKCKSAYKIKLKNLIRTIFMQFYNLMEMICHIKIYFTSKFAFLKPITIGL